jgi:hypothetical protein
MVEDVQPQVQNQKSNNASKIFIIVIILLGFITTFVSGFLLSRLFTAEQNASIGQVTRVTPYPTNPQLEQDTTVFLPGKYYFDDTVIVVTKDNPRINLVASVTRTEQEKDYLQNTRVSYYDGNTWTRQTDSKTTKDSGVVSNNLLKSWDVTIDQSRVLKQTVHGEVTINNTSVAFSTGILQNEIGMRSLPGYTKFMSNGSGTININGTVHQAYIVYTRIYSLNAADIQYYNQSLGLTTDWIAFWDAKGNFYHIDKTSVDKPTQIYQTHQIGVLEDATGAVTKTFEVKVTRDSKNPPEKYAVSLNNPVGAALKLNRINGINKAPNGSFTWYMGNVEGTVQKDGGESISGIGLVEYIHN